MVFLGTVVLNTFFLFSEQHNWYCCDLEGRPQWLCPLLERPEQGILRYIYYCILFTNHRTNKGQTHYNDERMKVNSLQ